MTDKPLRNVTSLAIWTVYEHPKDYPNCYVARRFDVGADGAVPSASLIIAPDIEMLRYVLGVDMHLTRLERNPGDDAKIMECWI